MDAEGVRFLLCTYRNRGRAETVVQELNEMKIPVTVIVHDEVDFPVVGDFDKLVQPSLGWAKSLDFGIRQLKTKWIGWVNDDSLFPDGQWWEKTKLLLVEQYKLIAFNDGRNRGRWASLGLTVRDWYLKHYCHGQPYTHYGLDNELVDLAKREKVYFYAEKIQVIHDFDNGRVNHNHKVRDVLTYKERRINAPQSEKTKTKKWQDEI